MVYKLTCQKMLTASEIAGISVAVSAVGLALLWYLGYVSWYGRFGLPKLQRVSKPTRGVMQQLLHTHLNRHVVLQCCSLICSSRYIVCPKMPPA